MSLTGSKAATGIRMKFQLVLFLAMLLAISAATFAQEINIETKGTCKDFDIKINANLEGCWDAKVEAAGEILHPDGWKSSFFYVNNAMCSGEAELKLKLNTKDDVIASLKLRQNTTILERDFEINQNCPTELTDKEFLLLIAAIIIILAAGIAIYAKKPKKRAKPKARKNKQRRKR